MKNSNFISSTAKIGNNVKIAVFCVIEDDVIINDDVVIQEYSMIQKGSVIGKGTKIGTYTKVGKNCVIGEYCSFTSYCEIRDNCKLGNKVTMGSRCTLSANTIVEDDVLMKYSFVVTDTPNLSDNNLKQTGLLKKGCRFGANVTVMPSVVIGENSEIGANSQVRHDVPDNETWFGIPAKFYRKNT